MAKQQESPPKKQKVQQDQTLPTFFYEVAATIEEKVTHYSEKLFDDLYEDYEISETQNEIDSYNKTTTTALDDGFLSLSSARSAAQKLFCDILQQKKSEEAKEGREKNEQIVIADDYEITANGLPEWYGKYSAKYTPYGAERAIEVKGHLRVWMKKRRLLP